MFTLFSCSNVHTFARSHVYTLTRLHFRTFTRSHVHSLTHVYNTFTFARLHVVRLAHYCYVIFDVAVVTVLAGLPGPQRLWAAGALVTHCQMLTYTMRPSQFQYIAVSVHGTPNPFPTLQPHT